jgi:hypothetical protein
MTTIETRRERHAMEDDCWNISALENVNSLAASIVPGKI